MSDFAFLSASQASSLLAHRQISSVEYTRALLERIEGRNRALSAFIELTAERALADAKRVDDLRVAGCELAAIAGIPYAVKDLLDVANRHTTAQSAASTRHAGHDSAVVNILQRHNAVLLGKLSLEEWGIGSPLDDLPWPPARNPWAKDRTPGGSSSGCGSALAAGLIPLAVGTDTAGSVRNPAALCGVVGLKPSRGRISRAGVVTLSWTLDHLGPMARSAADCRLLFDVLAKPSASTPYNRRNPIPGLRICVPESALEQDLCSEETRKSVIAASMVLEAQGAVIVSSRTPDFRKFYDAVLTVLHAEAYRNHRLRLWSSPGGYGARAFHSLISGSAIRSSQYAYARATGSVLRDELKTTFAECDILAMPVVDGPACLLSDARALARAGRGVLRAPFNLSGHPALSLCSGFSSDGLPLALQLVGRPGSDELLLDVAAAYQRVTDWHLRQPKA